MFTFQLSIPVTIENIAIIKDDLRKTIPNVKSSHRCEALARGLGFRTYNSLLNYQSSHPSVSVSADGSIFRSYLLKREFETNTGPFYRAVAKAAIYSVMTKERRLTAWGFGAGGPQRNPDGSYQTAGEYFQRIQSEKAELLSDYAIDPFLLCLALLRRVERTKTVRSGNSYWVKHIAENFDCIFPEGEKLGLDMFQTAF